MARRGAEQASRRPALQLLGAHGQACAGDVGRTARQAGDAGARAPAQRCRTRGRAGRSAGRHPKASIRLNASRRGMQDYQLAESRRLEALEQQLQQQQQQALQAAASSAAASRQAPAPAEPRQQMSQFAAYMQEKQQQSAGPAGGAGGGSAGSMLRSPSDATAPTRLPALKTPAAGRQPPTTAGTATARNISNCRRLVTA